MIVLGLSLSTAAGSASPLLLPPVQGGRSVPVRVGLFVANLISVDESKELWQFSGELRLRWRDPRLRFDAPPGAIRHYEANQIWIPRINIANTLAPRKSATPDVFVDPSGSVDYVELMWDSATTELDVHRFPFDAEHLPVIFEPLGRDAPLIRLIADPALSGVNAGSFTPLSQWRIRRLDIGTQTIAASMFHPAHTVANFRLVVSRNPQSFIWKFMVPLFAIVLLSWLAFWMPSDEYGIKEQLGISITTLLTTVAFTLALTSFLPRVAYFTFIDGYVLFSFLWVLGAMAIVYIQAYLKTHGRQGRATELRRIAAFAMPLSFLLAQAILFIALRPT